MTSLQAYAKSEEVRDTCTSKVYRLLRDGKARNSRMIAKDLGLERTSVCKALNTLEMESQRIVSEQRICDITKFNTKFYTIEKEKSSVASTPD
ncbi:MAG: hypothetical protein AAF738_01005 [Bacteroidota bacterium]